MKFLSCVALLIGLCSLFTFTVVAGDDIGIPVYPNATEMPKATERLLQTKAPGWLAARVYRTNDPIKTVVKYFREQAATKPAAPVDNPIIKRLLEDNWMIGKRTLTFRLDLGRTSGEGHL